MRALLALVLLSLTAGCMSEAPTAEEAPVDAIVVTDAADNTALVDGDMGWHLHDYWDGETRRTAANAELHTGGWNCGGCDYIPLRFRGETDQIVPLGTSAIEVEMEWTLEGEQRYADPELWVKRANDREPRYVSKIQSGVPVVFNVTNEEADPPHQVLSRWEYFLMLPAIQQEARTAGEFHLYAEAIRGLEIPLFPPHPDHWNGGTELVLFEDTVGPFLQWQNVEEGSNSCEGGCASTHVPTDGMLVPHDAREVVVTLTYGPGVPATLGIRSHGGDTWEMVAAREEIVDPTTRVFRIPVTPETGDSPYAQQSIWEIAAWIDQPAPLRAFAGEYTARAVALK